HARKKMQSSIGIAPPNVGISQRRVAALFGTVKNALPKMRSSANLSGVSIPIVRQNAFRGNLRSGRQANHHPGAPMGTTNNPRLQVYPRGVGLSEVDCKIAG